MNSTEGHPAPRVAAVSRQSLWRPTCAVAQVVHSSLRRRIGRGVSPFGRPTNRRSDLWSTSRMLRLVGNIASWTRRKRRGIAQLAMMINIGGDKMKLPLSIIFVAMLMTTTVFAELGAVNVKFRSSVARDVLGEETETMTVGGSYSFSVALYDGNGRELYAEYGSSQRCSMSGWLGEANTSTTTCQIYAKKAGNGTLTYIYRSPNVGYDLTTTMNINILPARCTIVPKQMTTYPLQKREIKAECSDLKGKRTDCPELRWYGNGGNFSNQNEINVHPERARIVDYTASQYIGKYKVYATDGELTDPSATYCEMIVDVLPGSASKVTIAPKSAAELKIGENVSFTVSVKDVNNNNINDSDIFWSVNGSVGNVSQRGVFTAASAGRGTIKATVDCPFMAAGCPFASVDVVVVQSAQPQTPPEMPPAPPAITLPTQPVAPPSAPSQPQPPAAIPQEITPLQIMAIALVVVIGLATVFFLLTAKKKE